MTFNYPFSITSPSVICDNNSCGASPSPSQSSVFYCGGSLVNSTCPPCSFEDSGSFNTLKFLGCDVVGFSARLGYNGSESTLTIDLVATGSLSSPTASPCANFTDLYGTYHQYNCTNCPPSPSSSPVSNTYTGSLGYVYTFSLGSFCFRGILIDHQYMESDNGYRYRVTLSDGRQLLSGVFVILNDLYIRPPDELRFNLINALYEIEDSVGNDTCIDGNKCEKFAISGDTVNKGMYLKKALQNINGKQCQIPISKGCLSIDLSKIISITPTDTRVSSNESTVLDLVTFACQEAGYDFYVEIVGNSIRVFPINNKNITIPDSTTGAGSDAGAPLGPLFKFLNELSNNYVIIDREYGQEMTFNKSKKMVYGDHYKYLTIIDNNSHIDDPGSIPANIARSYQSIIPFCSPAPSASPTPSVPPPSPSPP